MNQLQNFKHPLPLNTPVRANKPQCQCKGGGTTPVSGKILKIIENQAGTWYYLDSGNTIQSTWITEIL